MDCGHLIERSCRPRRVGSHKFPAVAPGGEHSSHRALDVRLERLPAEARINDTLDSRVLDFIGSNIRRENESGCQLSENCWARFVGQCGEMDAASAGSQSNFELWREFAQAHLRALATASVPRAICREVKHELGADLH